MIRVVNLKIYTPNDDEVLFKIDRTTSLGNPFIMKDESQRDWACDEYREYFNQKVKFKHPNVMNLLDEIYETSLITGIALGCWCKQAGLNIRCHGDTIKEYLDSRIYSL